jgi:hypothetical protein
LAALGWLISAGPLAAQTTANWNPVFGVGGSSDWFNFINWSTLAVPDSSTDVVIDLGTGYDQPIISGNYAEAVTLIWASKPAPLARPTWMARVRC